MRKHFAQEPAVWSPCHHRHHFQFVYKLHTSSAIWPLPPLAHRPPLPALYLPVLLNSQLSARKPVLGEVPSTELPAHLILALAMAFINLLCTDSFSPTRLWVPLRAGTPCYIPLLPCLMLSLGNREFGQRPPLCSHFHYLFLSCARSAPVILALLFCPVYSTPTPA